MEIKLLYIKDLEKRFQIDSIFKKKTGILKIMAHIYTDFCDFLVNNSFNGPIIHDDWILNENKSDGLVQYSPPGNKGCLAHWYAQWACYRMSKGKAWESKAILKKGKINLKSK